MGHLGHIVPTSWNESSNKKTRHGSLGPPGGGYLMCLLFLRTSTRVLRQPQYNAPCSPVGCTQVADVTNCFLPAATRAASAQAPRSFGSICTSYPHHVPYRPLVRCWPGFPGFSTCNACPPSLPSYHPRLLQPRGRFMTHFWPSVTMSCDGAARHVAHVGILMSYVLTRLFQLSWAGQAQNRLCI